MCAFQLLFLSFDAYCPNLTLNFVNLFLIMKQDSLLWKI